MFYDYLKSIYGIVENYSPDSDNFKNMLNLNDYFINAIDRKSFRHNDTNFDDFNKISGAQKGGSLTSKGDSLISNKSTTDSKLRVVKILSLQNSKLLGEKKHIGGATHVDELNAMHKSVMDIINAIPPRMNCTGGTVDLTPIVSEVQRVKLVFENLVNYIQYLHRLLPDQANVEALNRQLTSIRNIINKYA